MDHILEMSAAEIARQIRSKTLNPVDVVEAHIRRIEQVNPRINAVVTPMFEQARAQAQAAQERITAEGTDDLPPMFGVPVTVKDSLPVKDVRFTGGSWHLRDNTADHDARAVIKLREAGAIILGKTNLPDMCWAGEAKNPVFGQTNNPHHLKHTPGGSSGGEGAIIAAGGSPFGIGSDIAGSVRIPAAACGIVALKPSGGRIPTAGHVPSVEDSPIENFQSVGPMARRIEDLALGLEVLSETPTQDYRQIEIGGRRCLVYIHNHAIPVHRTVAETVAQAAGTLKSAGLDVKRDDGLPMAAGLLNYMTLMSQHGNPGIRAGLAGDKPYNFFTEMRKNWRGEGEITPYVLYFTDMVVGSIGIAGRLLGLGGFKRLGRLRQQFLDAMGAGGVLLTPVFIAHVPRHGWTWRSPTLPTYTMMFNAMEMPGVVLPIGWDQRGLPLAVQIVARPGEDEVALAVAAELERVYGGWRMAATLEKLR